MTEPFKSFGITIFTYDITGRQIDARHGTVSLYEGADLALPVRAETTMVYEDDGHGSAVLRVSLGASKPATHGRFKTSRGVNVQ